MAKSTTAKMYMKPGTTNLQFGCYSERGLMSYFMFIDLPKCMPKFLQALNFPKDEKSPFNDITITNAIIFSELDLGKSSGFGCPDGAVYFEYKKDGETISTMILIEVKANETYEESFNPKKEYKKDYNSTIKGQLELRWRMKELLLNNCFCNDELKPYVQGSKYLREIECIRDSYVKDKGQSHDGFYSKNKMNPKNPLANWRRLVINETGKDNDQSGVKKFIDKLQDCGNEVYFLVISKDESNPFDKVSSPPRCFSIEKEEELKWAIAKKQFCWLPITWIENEDSTKNSE